MYMRKLLLSTVVSTGLILTPVSGLSSASGSSTAFRIIQAQSPDLTNSQGEKITEKGFMKEGKKNLVVVLPQLGEFDSAEYAEFLVAALGPLEKANIDLTVIGIGKEKAAEAFLSFTKLPRECLLLDPEAKVHDALKLHSGPNWDLPKGLSDHVLRFALSKLPGDADTLTGSELRTVGRAWLNYLAMCAGLGAPGTLREILRGYFGDKKAPERFRKDDVVKVGFVTIGPGIGPVKIGPISYDQWFSDETGYQRPVELATVRLKNMVEVLTKWDTYVTDALHIDKRGATYLFDEDGSELYQYRSRGILTYSSTMPRPLTFLSPYIGEELARNPLALPDTGGGDYQKGRGVLKPAGKAMGLLSTAFKLENRLQAQLLGATDTDYAAARQKIQNDIQNEKIVVYTYGLSPFSTETTALLDELGVDYKKVEVGLEWFLLDKEASTLRAQLLEMTGQSSLPQVFIGGTHVGGLFTGAKDGQYPGLAGLRESGELFAMLDG